MRKPQAIVLCGDGINCDVETQLGLELAGFSATRVHSSDFLQGPQKLFQAQLLVIPGGFSFGDEIASGKILALKLRKQVEGILHEYIDQGKLVLGVCNGFQVLTQMGLLPFSEPAAPRVVSLTRNLEGRFLNRWVDLEVQPNSSSPFFASLNRIELPIRHGEGRLRIAELDPAGIAQIKAHAPLRYIQNVNGSYDNIAALTNTKGNVLGLMPHPEAFVRWTQHPAWSRMPGRRESSDPHGLIILQNACRAAT